VVTSFLNEPTSRTQAAEHRVFLREVIAHPLQDVVEHFHRAENTRSNAALNGKDRSLLPTTHAYSGTAI